MAILEVWRDTHWLSRQTFTYHLMNLTGATLAEPAPGWPAFVSLSIVNLL